jgi:hypothetical protein
LTSAPNFHPIIRLHGPFSALSTIRQKSETADIAILELSEKEILTELFDLGCIIKVICTLDVEHAFHAGYSLEQLNERISDLCRTFDAFGERGNFYFAIDNHMIIGSTWIVDSSLLIEQRSFVEGSNYSFSFWTSDSLQLKRAIIDFETRFTYLNNYCNPFYSKSPRECILDTIKERYKALQIEELSHDL